MLDFYSDYRNFGYGSGALSPDNRSFYINIPKNASSFMNSCLAYHGWTTSTVNHWGTDWNKVENLVVVLRDPVDRWLSGISQYVKTYILSTRLEEYLDFREFEKNYNLLSERLFFDQLHLFDDHVWPQYCFFDKILPNAPRTYFYVNKNLEDNIYRFFDFDTSENADLNYNNSADDRELGLLKTFFSNKVSNNEKLLRKIKESYETDYKIINSNNLIY